MRVSTKGRYALRIIIDLAEHDQDEFISLKDIATRQEISMKYLEMIVGLLNKADFVTSQRGKAGGYKLSRPVETYTVGSILKAAEGSLAPVTCLECEENTCERSHDCITLPMWTKLDQIVDDYLESVTIYDLMNHKI